MLRTYERWLGQESAAIAILRLPGLFDRPARSDLLDALCSKPAVPGLTDALVKLPKADWLRTLSELQQLGVIEQEECGEPAKLGSHSSVAVDAQELLREHFAPGTSRGIPSRMVAQDAPPGGRDAHPTRDIATVSERSAQTIEIAERNRWLLDIALDHLTLGRAALYRAILGAVAARRLPRLARAGRDRPPRRWNNALPPARPPHPRLAAGAGTPSRRRAGGPRRGAADRRARFDEAPSRRHPPPPLPPLWKREAEGGSGKDPGDKNPDGTRPGTERRGGVLAAWAYGVIVVEGEEVNHLADEFYSETVGPGWPPERVLVEQGYHTIPFPYAEITPPAWRMETSWTLGQLPGYFSTWSATDRCIKATGKNPLEPLAAGSQRGCGDPNAPRRIEWPLSVRVGRK